MEDVDLANRIRAVHAVIAYASEALVFHPWRSISEREVYRQVVSHAIYAEKHPEFVHRWTMKHLVRAMRGRVRLYANGGFSSIPLAKYRTVVFDFFAPVLVYILMHNGLLRKWLNRRHCN